MEFDMNTQDFLTMCSEHDDVYHYLENGVHYSIESVNTDFMNSYLPMSTYLHLYLPEDMFYDLYSNSFKIIDDQKDLYKINKKFMLNSINYDSLQYGQGFGEFVFKFFLNNEDIKHVNDIKWFDSIVMKLVDDLYKVTIMRTLSGEEGSLK